LDIDFKKLISYKKLSNIQNSADEFRLKYWGDGIPVDIELIIERDLNILVIPIESLKHSCQTDAMILRNMEEIVYDPNVPVNRLRYSIAHEVGHLILHKKAIEHLRPESYDNWFEVIQSIPETVWGTAEFQAYEFAGRLLVPVDKLNEEINNLSELIDTAKKEIPNIEQEVLIEYISPKISKVFTVSPDVISRRIKIEEIKL
jgi:Zn-dependent peptidase ImmA (M78 family)